MFNDKYGRTQAVLEGRKTMTRRVITVPDKWHGIEVYGFSHVKGEHTLTLTDGDDFIIEDPDTGEIGQILPAYKPGDVVAVAQAYRNIPQFNPDTYEDVVLDYGTICGASHPYSHLMRSSGWDNKMFVRADLMPHRIRITTVRVERLRDINSEDCLKEGIEARTAGCHTFYFAPGIDWPFSFPKPAFAALIDKISGKGAWEKNPWVFVYTFELVI